MLGKNLKLPPDHSNPNSLKINSVFFTFQGEGPYTGLPAVFIRLSGCNLSCEFCDTEFEQYQILEVNNIIKQVKKLLITNKAQNPNLVVLTGGEPMRQNLVILCKELISNNFTIQIESNGTIFQDLPEQVNIVCSPKTTNGKHYGIDKRLLPKITAFKFLISANNPNYNEVPNLGQDDLKIPTYLQPIDEYDKIKNMENHNLTIKLAKKYGYRISLQTHKIWGIE